MYKEYLWNTPAKNLRTIKDAYLSLNKKSYFQWDDKIQFIYCPLILIFTSSKEINLFDQQGTQGLV